MTIGEKIVQLRKKVNLTQEKLAEKLNVSRQTISNWESNITSPDLSQAKFLIEIFHISLDELVDNNIEIKCNNSNDIFLNMIGKDCYLDVSDKDYRLNFNTLCKLISINDNFIKIEFEHNKKIITKLIDLDLIHSIRFVENEVNE